MARLGEVAHSTERRRASLIVLAGWEIGREVKLTEEETVFGRSLGATTRIAEASVSREHARIALVERDGDRFYEISDLGSRNGTYVNNTVVESTRLKHGDKVQIGEVVFKFLLQDALDSQFHQDVHRLIHYDQLTGLLTMDTFWRRIEAEMHKAHEHRFTLAMTDLDGLKAVNDTYGHLAGRMVVGEMGAIIRETVRSKDYAGLYGGDEAIILFTDTPLAEAQQVAEELRKCFETRRFDHQGHTFQVTISQGLAEWPKHGVLPDELIAAADAALYKAKDAGRNCVQCAGD